MTIESVRSICRALPRVSEDIKWGHDLCFIVGGKMFAVVSMEPPHPIAFKCTPDIFGELVERPGIIPAPYMARNMWVAGAGAWRRPGPARARSTSESVIRAGRREAAETPSTKKQ